ncbi:MAG: hypothetical protein QNJ16_08675 [Rhodobacter sp.]|nr:hypothetical protein [Rhodobacter sp.]
MRLALLLAALLLAGCARPLAEGERAFAADLFGDGLDLEQTRVAQGLGVFPATTRAKPLPKVSGKIEPRPGVCDRVETGLEPGPPPAFAVRNRVHVMSDFYRADTMPGWPDTVLLPQALIMAHELVHVWQWQNRAVTGYRPGSAALESLTNADPYFYVPEPGAGFLEYGYEQQAALIEDYLCYALFDPKAPRRAELRTLLAPYFALDRLDAALAR